MCTVGLSIVILKHKTVDQRSEQMGQQSVPAPPSVPAFDTGNVKVSDTPPKCIKPLTVNETDGDAYLCDLETAQAEFTVQKLAADPEFCLYYTSGTLTPPQYDLSVSCTDKEGKGNIGVIRVYVEPNQPPVVAGSPSLTATLDVSTYTTGTPVFTILATDADNDAITFTTTTGDPNFTVDPNTGEIFPSADPRSMTATSATLTVEVSDNVAGHTPVTANIVINLQNLNVVPVLRNFAALSPGVTIPEDQGPGDLFTLDVDDSLAVPKVTISGTVNPASETSMFEFNDAGPYSVKLAAGKKFDAKVRTSYNVTVTLFDGFLSSPPYTIPITIQDVNDPPVFSQPTYAVAVNEGGANTRTFTPPGFATTDAESDTVTYSIGTASQSSMFSVDPSTGALTNIVALDYEDATTPKPVRAEVCASDGKGGQACALVDITLKDINDNKPQFAAGTYTHKVSLTTPASTQFQQLVATDKDSNENADIVYSLDPSCVASGLFAIVGDFITLAQTINVLYGTPLSCDVLATDKGVDPGPLSDTQTISFIWNERPIISGPDVTKSISQNTAAGTFVHTLAVTDAEGDVYGCIVASSTPPSAPFSAAIETGTTYGIKFDGGTLDSTSVASYKLTVDCSDGNGGKDSKFITLNIEPNKAPSSSCTPSAGVTLDVSTPIPANTAVYDFRVTDPDNDPITITITETPSTGMFVVNTGTQKLEVTKDLRTETQSSYTLNVNINDGKNLPVTCVLTISITNLNMAPVIANAGQTVSWSENTAVGTVLFPTDVQDTDPTTVTMSVTPTSGSSFFEIDPASKLNS
ncbi:protocadherin-16-like [Gigantopelta aegis]|uniref:protocadherin-16-like n=1 Tax=Gigantopelta aegis TaxID=1735272 RepID=UPI001B887DEB|nr:protocadherin-16-like [Gigantopelta aegis]